MSSRFSSQYVRKCFLKCLNFLAKILNSERILTDSKNSDRAPIGIVRLVRSLADRTFQLRSQMGEEMAAGLREAEEQEASSVNFTDSKKR